MALRDLITWGRDQPSVPSRRGEEVSPFLTLHREMNRLFDDVFNSFGNTPSLLGRLPAWPASKWSSPIRTSGSRPNCRAWTRRMSRCWWTTTL